MPSPASTSKNLFWALNSLLGVAFIVEIAAPRFSTAFDAVTIALAAMASIAALNRQLPLQNVLPAKDAPPSEQALTVERAAAVRAEVSRLPEDLREATVLCEWEECSIAEAAAILETTPKAVESRLYRARKVLRERLKGWL